MTFLCVAIIADFDVVWCWLAFRIDGEKQLLLPLLLFLLPKLPPKRDEIERYFFLMCIPVYSLKYEINKFVQMFYQAFFWDIFREEFSVSTANVTHIFVHFLDFSKFLRISFKFKSAKFIFNSKTQHIFSSIVLYPPIPYDIV